MPFNDEDILRIVVALGLPLSMKEMIANSLAYVYLQFAEEGMNRVRDMLTELEGLNQKSQTDIQSRDYALKKADVLEWDTSSGISPVQAMKALRKELEGNLRVFLGLPIHTYPGYTRLIRRP